jgi:sporulation protein YlmC with PRC-barrel domain
MRLELGTDVDCRDGRFGRLADIVIDPTTKRVTHLVVEPTGENWSARLVPIELAHSGDAANAGLVLQATRMEVRSLPNVRETSYLRLDGFPVEDPDWTLGIEEVFALPYYPAYDLQPDPLDYVVTYDRIPKSEVEIRRASDVYSADKHRLGQVDGFAVDADDHVTHLVLEHGHPWDRTEVTVPIAAVARVETDAVILGMTRAEVEALPPVAVHRWSRLIEGGKAERR